VDRLPIRVRLTAAFALAMLLVLVAAASFVYVRQRSALTETIDHGLERRSDDVAARWSALAVGATGSTVEWQADGAQRRGVTAGIDGDGALLIRAGTSTERVVAGEVIWL